MRGIVMVNGDRLLGLRPVDAERANDRFDHFRCGLDHLSFAVASRAELKAAAQAFKERGVDHSDITELPPLASRSCRSRTPTGSPSSSPPPVADRADPQPPSCIWGTAVIMSPDDRR
jgi:hypothetical protein